MDAGWIMPYQYNHPDFGQIWMGGSMRKHIGRTPAARYIEEEAEKNAMFVLYCADQFPVVKIDKVDVSPVSSNVFRVSVTVANDKVYPTSSDMSVRLKRSVEDKLSLATSDNITIVPATTPAVGAGRGASRSNGCRGWVPRRLQYQTYPEQQAVKS